MNKHLRNAFGILLVVSLLAPLASVMARIFARRRRGRKAPGRRAPGRMSSDLAAVTIAGHRGLTRRGERHAAERQGLDGRRWRGRCRGAARMLDIRHPTRAGARADNPFTINALRPLPRCGTALGLGPAEPTGDKEVGRGSQRVNESPRQGKPRSVRRVRTKPHRKRLANQTQERERTS